MSIHRRALDALLLNLTVVYGHHLAVAAVRFALSRRTLDERRRPAL